MINNVTRSHVAESSASVGEKSLFKLIPDFKESTDADKSDDILFKFGSIKADWEEEALKQAGQESDLRDDEYSL